MASGSDPALNIAITTTADTAGIAKAEAAIKTLGDEAQQTSRIIDATGANPASAEQLAAMYLRDAAAAAEFSGTSRLATAELTAAEKATIGAAKGTEQLVVAETADVATGSKYAAILNVIGRSLGGIIGRDLTKDVGIEGVGRAIEPILGKQLAGLAGGGAATAGAVTAEGAAATVATAAFSAFGIAIAGAAAAGIALAAGGVAVTSYIEGQTKSAKDAGEAFDDFIASRNKAIINAPTTKEAGLDANLKVYQEIDKLQAIITAGTTKYAVNLSGEVGGAVSEVIHLTKDAQDATDQLAIAQAKLTSGYKEAAAIRDARPSTDKENADIEKVQQDFNKAAYDALPPLLQQAQATQNIADYLNKAKDALAGLQGKSAVPQDLLDSVHTFEDLKDIIPQLSDGAQRMAAGFAKGGLELDKFAEKAKDSVDKVNKAEADDQAAAAAKIVEDQEKLIALGVSQQQVQQALAIRSGEVTKSKNAGAQAALRQLATDKETGKVNKEIADLTAEILTSNLELEASKKRQLDAQAELKKFQEDLAIKALPQSSQDDIKGIDATLAKNRKTAPGSEEEQQNLADNTSALKVLKGQIEKGIPLTHAGDIDDPLGAVTPDGASASELAENRAENESRMRVLKGQVEDDKKPLQSAGDIDNPFGDKTKVVADSVAKLQTEAATALGDIADQFNIGLGALTDLTTTALTGMVTAVGANQQKLQTLQGQVDYLLGQVNQ